MSQLFDDHFSKVAKRYANFRPHYPAALFDYLATLVARSSLVWDCACGNGQATLDLAMRFDRVVATDASREQIASATSHPNIQISSALTGRRSGDWLKKVTGTIPFPFAEITVPTFRMEVRWTLDQLLGHFGTWSATSRYIKATGRNPLETLSAEQSRVWGDADSPRLVVWPLSLRAGY